MGKVNINLSTARFNLVFPLEFMQWALFHQLHYHYHQDNKLHLDKLSEIFIFLF